jgi:uncharacterized protein YdeI (YjbR/CyaY-like superfamily)
MKPEIESFCPTDQQDWRKWLAINHEQKDAVWLIIYKKNSPTPNLTWSEAVDEALCFGWIDSVKKTVDNERYKQYFSKRKAKSNWSKINKAKIDKLSQLGLIAEAGIKSIEIAKKNGSWTILDAVENLEIPLDLDQKLAQTPEAKDYFLSLSKSVQKQVLYWIISAKRPETRQKRIDEIVIAAANREKPTQF